MYEEMVTAYGRSDLALKATEEYRLAIEADPSSEFLTSGLAELYVKTGRIADAVKEAQDIIKRDPKNLEAHKLLGRIYLRSLGDMPGGSGSDNILKLAIDQYETIVKLDPDSVDDHLLLGRLYRLNNDLQKGENELKTAIKLDPSSEEAVTTLAMLYTDEGDTAHALQVLRLDSRLRPLGQAVRRSGRGLRTAQGLQERHRRLPSRHCSRPRQSRRHSRPRRKSRSTTANSTPRSNNTKSSPIPIPKTRKPMSAWPKFTAAKPSTISPSKISSAPTPSSPTPWTCPTAWPPSTRPRAVMTMPSNSCRIC